MPYDSKKGWVPMTVPEITDMLRIGVNEKFGTTYTRKTFQGTGYWKLFQPLISQVRNFELGMVDHVGHLKKLAKTLFKDSFSSDAGLQSGIFRALKALEEVSNVAIYNPNKLLDNVQDFEGKIAIAIQTTVDIDSDPKSPAVINAKQKIANAIVNHMGAGIRTDENAADYQANGILAYNGQVQPVCWRKALETPVYLRLSYKQAEGLALPTLDDIKQKLLDNLASYKFGTRFTPSLYSNLCDFPYFRDVELEYRLSDTADWVSTEFSVGSDNFHRLFLFSKDQIDIVQMPE